MNISKACCPYMIGKSGGKLYRLTDHFEMRPDRYSVMKFELPPQGRVAEHCHPADEETYYVVRGMAEVNLDHKLYILNPGDLLYVPPSKKHSLKNTGDEELTLLVIFSSAEALERSIYVEE